MYDTENLLFIYKSDNPHYVEKHPDIQHAGLKLCNSRSPVGYQMLYQDRCIVAIKASELYKERQPDEPIEFFLIHRYHMMIACKANSIQEMIHFTQMVEPKPTWWQRLKNYIPFLR